MISYANLQLIFGSVDLSIASVTEKEQVDVQILITHRKQNISVEYFPGAITGYKLPWAVR